MKRILLILLFFASQVIIAQTGTVRGRVTDNITDQPLEGATVIFVADSTINTTTDADGRYRLENLPVGRVSLSIVYVGYEPVILPNIDVITGKDVPADVRLTESYSGLDEVVISSGPSKDKALNKLAAVSARQVSVEEITKYAGGRSDVARLAANFAGVSAPNDSRNDIVVRGNSPTGLLWRIDGIPVPSPNHFSTLGTTGSPVSALNPSVMGNSDFITSAFPAEYGNALGGVFDINFRRGNSDDYEYTMGVGVMTGFEGVAEGPLGRQGSFLVAARYGIAGAFGGLGTAAVPNYGDVSFNLDFGKTKAGSFALFGIVGNSTVELNGSDLSEEELEDDLFAAPDENNDFTSRFGMMGLRHTLAINDFSSLKTTIGGSFSAQRGEVERIFDYGTPQAVALRNADVNHKILGRLEQILSDYFNDGDLATKGLPTVQFVSDALNVSPGYLSGLLKVLTGESTQQHIQNKVIEKAKERLSTTDLTINEIAYELGFEYPQSFSKLFKKKTDQSPMEFRASFN